MAEVRTQPVAASFLLREDFWGKDMVCLVPGSILRNSLVDSDDQPEQGEHWYYACPCGCGRAGGLYVGTPDKPTRKPSWAWNGDVLRPTLTPSVHHVGHWHGFLTDGMWVSV